VSAWSKIKNRGRTISHAIILRQVLQVAGLHTHEILDFDRSYINIHQASRSGSMMKDDRVQYVVVEVAKQ
jgi:hypothetical protein